VRLSAAFTGRRTVLVAGGKGGVGKTTVAVLLALGLSRRMRVGLLDADLSGPSVPRALGLDGRPRVANGCIEPVRALGLDVMSVGLLAPPDKAFAWQGPLLRGVLYQLLSDVSWRGTDALVIDTPPGTAETHLALLDLLRPTAAVVVTTPHPLAAADTSRCLSFLRGAEVPVVAAVNNMAEYRCERCGALARMPEQVTEALSSVPVVTLPFLQDASVMALGPALVEGAARGIDVLVDLVSAVCGPDEAGSPGNVPESTGCDPAGAVRCAEEMR
jgi:Mrp family chromosome partitioning ATPase